MLVYFVIGDSTALKDKVESEYPDHHEEFVGGWSLLTIKHLLMSRNLWA